jgi:TfoX/Sxy family transcriptional regulator of competence genes
MPYLLKSLVQQYQGDYDGALETYRKGRIFSGKAEHDPLWELMQAHAHAVKGERDAATAALERAFQTPEYRKKPTNFALDVAVAHNLLGDHQQALDWLGKINVKKRDETEFLIREPRLANLHSDARFAALTERWQASGKPNNK